MGCDIHAVLQKKNDKGEWETVVTDILPLRNYSLFGFLNNVRGGGGQYDGVATDGLPADFKTNKDHDGRLLHEGFFIGDHSWAHIDLYEFCNAKTPDSREFKRFEVTEEPLGYTVTFLDPEESGDEYEFVRKVQDSFDILFSPSQEGAGWGTQYRLVFGYDS